ncbi:MAG: hypothetical protein ACREFX_07195, partial [Opitutaceae bacterium]
QAAAQAAAQGTPGAAAGAATPSSPVAGVGTTGGAASSGIAPAPGQTLAGVRSQEENALAQTYLQVGTYLQNLPVNARGGLNVLDVPSAGGVPASALEAEGYNTLEKYAANELGPSWNTINGGVLSALLNGAPTLTAAQRTALGPGISAAFPFGPGIGNTAGSGVYDVGQYGGNTTLGAHLGVGSTSLEDNMWNIANVIPGTVPNTFYRADEFGNVTSAPQSAVGYNQGEINAGAAPATTVGPLVTSFGGDQPSALGSAPPAWFAADMTDPFTAPAPAAGSMGADIAGAYPGESGIQYATQFGA